MKIIKNRDKSKITKHLIISLFVPVKIETIYTFFTNLINSKLIYELVSSD